MHTLRYLSPIARPITRTIAMLALLLVLAAAPARPATAAGDHPHVSPGLVFVDYRNLAGGNNGILLMDLDPESENFGKILQNKKVGAGILPHHLYFNHDQTKLYNTALTGDNLYEVKLDKGVDGLPRIASVKAIDTGGSVVGEDIYFTEDGSRFYMTFMGGNGDPFGGTIGVFDAKTNQLIETIEAPVPDELPSDEPFILWPHGISANEELGLLMVTSTIHPAGTVGTGNTVTLIDINTNTPLKTYLVAESWDDLSSPVEVLLLRDDLPPYALVSTLNGGDIWIAAYNEETGLFDEFAKVIEGDEAGVGATLEFYIHENAQGEPELYVSFGVPGVVNVYSLQELPELTLKRQLPAGAGAHHMTFFKTESGREVIVVQNNLLNIEGLNAGTLTVLDIYTGEILGEIDMRAEHNMLPESIESAFGHGHDYHH